MASRFPLLFETDVAVIGGGPAGMAAAVAAARNGARVAVIERWPALGGESTMAHVNWWHTSDMVREVIFGFTQELVQRLERHGGVMKMPEFPKIYDTYAFNPEWLKVVYDELVREENIRCLCYTPCVEVLTEGRKITGVVLGTKQGLREIRASVYIDATGEGDVAAFAGAQFTVGRKSDGKVQGMTLVTEFCGVDVSQPEKFDEWDPLAGRKLAEAQERGEMPPLGSFWFRSYTKMRWMGLLMPCTSGNPLDNEDLTRATMDARLKLPKAVAFAREHHPGCKNLDITQTGFSLGIREGRHVIGRYVFDRPDIMTNRNFYDAIGQGFWGIDVHDPEGSGKTSWYNRETRIKVGTTYQIPYRVLIPVDFDNLMLAGRCASATHEGMAGLRVQSHCHIMGQAAGIGAAMSLDAGVHPGDIDTAELQRRLLDANVLIDLDRVAAARDAEQG